MTHDWKYDAEIVQSVKVPVIVAGGLGPENVEECIKQVKPAGVDSLTKTTWKYNDGAMEKDIPKVAEVCRKADLAAKDLTTSSLTWWIVFDPQTLEDLPEYAGEVEVDFYGKIQPKAVHATVRLRTRSGSRAAIMEALSRSFRIQLASPGSFQRPGRPPERGGCFRARLHRPRPLPL